MADTSNWQPRVENGCLFIDTGERRGPMLQHHACPGIGSYIHPLRIGPRNLCLTEDSPGITPTSTASRPASWASMAATSGTIPASARADAGPDQSRPAAHHRHAAAALGHRGAVAACRRAARGGRPPGVAARARRRSAAARPGVDAACDRGPAHRAVPLWRPVRAHAVSASPRGPGGYLHRQPGRRRRAAAGGVGGRAHADRPGVAWRRRHPPAPE